MLVLSRRIRETLVIDTNIIITILEIGQNRVRIGIEAPSGVAVLRGEIIDRQAKSPSSDE